VIDIEEAIKNALGSLPIKSIAVFSSSYYPSFLEKQYTSSFFLIDSEVINSSKGKNCYLKQNWLAPYYWQNPYLPLCKLNNLNNKALVFLDDFEKIEKLKLDFLSAFGYRYILSLNKDKDVTIFYLKKINPVFAFGLKVSYRFFSLLENFKNLLEDVKELLDCQCRSCDIKILGSKRVNLDSGFAFKAYLPHLNFGSLALYENGVRLTEAQNLDQVRELGAGLYSYWGRELFFSPTNSESPNTSHLSYRVLLTVKKPRSLPERSSKTTHLSSFFSLKQDYTKVIRERNFKNLLINRANNSFNKDAQGVVLFTSHLGSGGAERQLCCLARSLNEDNISVEVMLENPPKGASAHYLPLLRDQKIRTLNLASLSRANNLSPKNEEDFGTLYTIKGAPEEIITPLWSLYKYLEIAKPAVLHCFLDTPNLLGAIAGILAGVPLVVISFRNVIPTNFTYLSSQTWYLDWYRFLVKFKNVKVISNSKAGAQSYTAWIREKNLNIKIIPNGLDNKSIYRKNVLEVTNFKTKFNIPINTQIVSGIFRLAEEKRPFIFLATAEYLLAKLPNLCVVIAGIGHLQADFCAQIAKSCFKDRIFYLGQLSSISELLSCTDLLLVSSKFEGFPNVVLEAQTLGIPVVATAAGDVGEIVEDGKTGYVVDVNDYKRLGPKCEKLLSDKNLLAAFAEKARFRAKSSFTLERMYSETLNFYREHLTEKSDRFLGRGFKNSLARNYGDYLASVRLDRKILIDKYGSIGKILPPTTPLNCLVLEKITLYLNKAKKILTALPTNIRYGEVKLLQTNYVGDIALALLLASEGIEVTVELGFLEDNSEGKKRFSDKLFWDSIYHTTFYKALIITIQALGGKNSKEIIKSVNRMLVISNHTISPIKFIVGGNCTDFTSTYVCPYLDRSQESHSSHAANF
jgi:glycosyltransferase involved in cell wall biosynthesis